MNLYLRKNVSEIATTKPIECALIGDVEIIRECVYFLKKPNPEHTNNSMLCDEELYNVDIDGRQTELHLWKASGQKDYKFVKTHFFPQMDVFLISFLVMDVKSFANVKLKWLPQVKYYCPNAKIILVGCKTVEVPASGESCSNSNSNSNKVRKRNTITEKPITYNEGVEMAKQIGAFQYLLCSTLTEDGGLTEVFRAAGRSVLLNSVERESQNCELYESSGSRVGVRASISVKSVKYEEGMNYEEIKQENLGRQESGIYCEI